MENLLPIGKMAENNHITVAALRLYDKKNLLKPQYVDPETGYRYYSVQQNARLDLIAYMKELGMSLQEIAAVFSREDTALLETTLMKKKEQLSQQMRQLHAQQQAVSRALRNLERCRKSPAADTVTLEYMDRRLTWGMPVQADFRREDVRAGQLALLQETLVQRGVPYLRSYHLGTSVRKEDFCSGCLVPDRMFLLVDADFAFRQETVALESGMYACLYLDDAAGEQEGAEKLKAYCVHNGCTVGGDYICEIMTRFYGISGRPSKPYIRLQVPVQF